MERTATGWLALNVGEDSGPFVVGLVFAARMVPSLLLGLTAGTVADRTDRARLLTVVGLLGLVVMAFVTWLIASQTLHVVHVVGISFLAGCVHVFDTPSRQALTLDVVPRTVASNAVAWNMLAARFMAGAGGFAGGLLIGFANMAPAYLAIAIAYGVAALLVRQVRAPSVTSLSTARPAFGTALRSAARLVLDNPSVRTLTLASIACEIFAFSFGSAVPVIARDVLQGGPVALGILNGATGVGGTVALLVLAIVQRRGRLEPILGVVFLTYGASLLALAATRDLLLAGGVLLVTGACAATFDALQQTLLQLAVPEDQRGRAVGVWLLGLGSGPIGHLEMGTLTSSVGAPSALLINGSIVLVAALTLQVRAPSFRWRAPSSSR
jgi:MFS family permease